MNTDQIILERFLDKYPLQAAQAIEKLKDEELSALLNEFPIELNVTIVSAISSYRVAKFLPMINPNLVREIIEKIDVYLAELVLRQLEEDFRKELLSNITPKLSSILIKKLEYPAYSVGAMMNPITLIIRKEITIKELMAIAKEAKENIGSNVYVTDKDGKLEGIVPLHKILFVDETDQISIIMNTEVPKVYVDVSAESIMTHPGWKEHQSIPVVDKLEKLVGTLNFETILKKIRKTDPEISKHVVETSNALGELYRIGLTGFLQSVTK